MRGRGKHHGPRVVRESGRFQDFAPGAQPVKRYAIPPRADGFALRVQRRRIRDRAGSENLPGSRRHPSPSCRGRGSHRPGRRRNCFAEFEFNALCSQSLCERGLLAGLTAGQSRAGRRTSASTALYWPDYPEAPTTKRVIELMREDPNLSIEHWGGLTPAGRRRPLDPHDGDCRQDRPGHHRVVVPHHRQRHPPGLPLPVE